MNPIRQTRKLMFRNPSNSNPDALCPELAEPIPPTHQRSPNTCFHVAPQSTGKQSMHQQHREVKVVPVVAPKRSLYQVSWPSSACCRLAARDLELWAGGSGFTQPLIWGSLSTKLRRGFSTSLLPDPADAGASTAKRPCGQGSQQLPCKGVPGQTRLRIKIYCTTSRQSQTCSK